MSSGEKVRSRNVSYYYYYYGAALLTRRRHVEDAFVYRTRSGQKELKTFFFLLEGLGSGGCFFKTAVLTTRPTALHYVRV